jgi:hypothetical protein
MAMLVMRASQMDAITERQKRSYFQMANARGLRKVKPGKVQVERPSLLPTIVDAHINGMGYTPAELSRVAMIDEDDLRAWLLLSDATSHATERGLRIVR